MWVNIKLSLCVFVISIEIVQCLDLNCDFMAYTLDGYNCKVSKLYIEKNGLKIENIYGDHHHGKSNWNVEVLYIPSTSCIKYLPRNIEEYFSNLKKLEVHEACLKFITQNVFVGLKYLETVDVGKNLLSFIPADTFNNLIHLHSLILSDNKIEELETKTFDKLTSLKKLWLSGNSLEIIPETLFSKNFFLEEISLSKNRLKIIDAGVFSSLKHLKLVSLDENFCISKSFPKDSSLDGLSAEFSIKCTNDTEIVKSASFAEMTNELHELRKQVNESSEEVNKLQENLRNKSSTVDKLMIENKYLIESYRINLTISQEKDDDLQFRLTHAYKTISFLKESFDDLNENCSKIEENLNKRMSEKVEEDATRLNESREQLQVSELFNASIKTALAVTLFVLILFAVVTVVLIFFIRLKIKCNVNSASANDTEMQLKNQKDKELDEEVANNEI